jgi:hypothetical protein
MKATSKLTLSLLFSAAGLLGAHQPAMAQALTHTLHGSACFSNNVVTVDQTGMTAGAAGVSVTCPIVRFTTAAMFAGLTVNVVGNNLGGKCFLHSTNAAGTSLIGAGGVAMVGAFPRWASPRLLPITQVQLQSTQSVRCTGLAVGDRISHLEVFE